jgi:CRP-like cAMP-binding protein
VEVITMAVVIPIFAVLFIYWALSSQRASRAPLTNAGGVGLVPGISAADVSALARAIGSVPSPPPARVSREPIATERAATPSSAIPPVEHLDEGDTIGPGDLRYLLEADRAALTEHAEIHRYRARELVMREGDEAFGLCVLLSGRVGLLVEAGFGHHLVVDTVRPGELFAWSGAVPPYHYTATGHAMVDSEVAVLGKEELESLCEADPVLGYHLMREITVVMGRRVRDLETQLVGLC